MLRKTELFQKQSTHIGGTIGDVQKRRRLHAVLSSRASHTGALRCLAATLDVFLKSKMADARELQTNLTEYRAQLRQVSFL